MTRPYAKRRMSAPSKERFRKLKQYRDMPEDEFDEIWEKKLTGYIATAEFEDRINKKFIEFGEDYDLSDLKANDKLVLRGLAQAYITLEDLEAYSFDLRVGGIADTDILKLEKINNMMSVLRKDISNMQNDLKITRKIRKGDKEESVITYIETLKKAAKEFYESRMQYVWCDKCSMLLFTGWFLYPEENNKIQLICKRKLDNDTYCNNKLTITSRELLESKGVNIQNVPEYFK